MESFGDSILRLADWELRSPEFTALREHDDGGPQPIPVMVFQPSTDNRSSAWMATRSVWLDLNPHPNVLDALEIRGRGLLLRYAALDWSYQPMLSGGWQLPQFAAWGMQLADAVRTATTDLPDFRLGWLLNPFVKMDVGSQIRVGFLAATPELVPTTKYMAPEVLATWPTCGERSLVYLVGAVLRDLWRGVSWSGTRPITRVILRATRDDPADRYATLRELRDELSLQAGPDHAVRWDRRLSAWSKAEAGVGMLAMNRADAAIELLEEATLLDDECLMARRGYDLALARVSRLTPRRREPLIGSHRNWAAVEPRARELEDALTFKAALGLYATVDPATAPGGALHVARARCYLELGATGQAIDYARRALAIEARRTDAIEIEVRALLARTQYAEALERADALLTLLPSSSSALYVRARALLALRRLTEARDAFDAVIALNPTLIAAMLLRREADRMLLRVRATVGVQESASVADDDPLAIVRSMLLDGRPSDAIEELSAPAYADNPDARLLLADALLSAQRGDEALAVYVRVAQMGSEYRQTAVVGTALALLALGRNEEAVEMFGQACKSWPNNLDALEGYAQALEAQGRTQEAEAAHRQAAAARAARSDLRLRTQTSRR